MRIELKEIEQIENYLMKKMSSAENLLFEQKINANTDLKTKVDFQQNLMEGIRRLGVKNAIKNGQKKYKTNQFLKFGTIVFIVVVGILAILYFVNKQTSNAVVYCACEETNMQQEEFAVDQPGLKNCVDTCGTYENSLRNNPVLLPENDSLSVDANAYLEQELFEINTNTDTVIETENGLVVYIPAFAFDTDNKTVDFIIQEALSPADIIYAGLNTITKNKEELETGGMFYFDAFAKGQRVALKKELIVDVPTKPEKREGMQLYDGVKNELGELVWTNPKSIINPLATVDILSLDFYPPSYESKMNEWGYLNKEYKDSVYYSFAFDCADNILNPTNDSGIGYGEKLFISNCAACHFVDKYMTGPALKGARARWQNFSIEDNFYAFIKKSTEVIDSGDAYAINLFEKWGSITMPPNNLSNQQIDAIFNYVENYKPQKSKIVASSRGAIGMFMPLPQDDNEREYRDEIVQADSTSGQSECDCGINPASIKTIWNQKFNNTNLATKEFEERMPWIHKTCDNTILELYVNNLDRNLADIDAMAMQKLGGKLREKFAEFASRGDGKVELSTKAATALNNYYFTKSKAFQKAIAITNANYWAKQVALDHKMEGINTAAEERNNTTKKELFAEELAYNRKKVYADLGMEKPKPPMRAPLIFGDTTRQKNTNNLAEEKADISIPLQPTRSFLRTNINRLGWKNVDCLMSLRIGENATIKGNGKTSSISYSRAKIQILNAKMYSKINLYIIPTTFNSYVKLKDQKGYYNHPINKNLTYTVAAIAWNKNGDLFYYLSSLKTNEIAIDLKEISNQQWKNNIRKKLGAINNMAKELDYLDYAKKDENRQNRNKAKRNFRTKIKPYVFPCQCAFLDVGSSWGMEGFEDMGILQDSNNDNINLAIRAEIDPNFPGGTIELTKFLNANLQLDNVEKEGVVYVSFTVSNSGVIKNSVIKKGLSPLIDKEVLRVVKLMPNWEPGIINGKPVNINFIMPVAIRIL